MPALGAAVATERMRLQRGQDVGRRSGGTRSSGRRRHRGGCSAAPLVDLRTDLLALLPSSVEAALRPIVLAIPVRPAAREPPPDLGVPPLVGGDRPERTRTPLVLLDGGEGVVEHDCIALQLEIVQALGDVRGGHPSSGLWLAVPRMLPRARRTMTWWALAPRRPCRRCATCPRPTSRRRCPPSRSAWHWPTARCG